MALRRVIVTTLLSFIVLFLSKPVGVEGQELPHWPSEQEKRLNAVDHQLLEVQRQRFRALFANDKDRVEKLQKEFGALQKERRQLLRAQGKYSLALPD